MSVNAETHCGVQLRLRISPNVALVRIADPYGKLHDFYEPSSMLPPWATHDPGQVAHLLDSGLVELVDEHGNLLDPGRVWECLSTLIAMGVPADAGAPRARDALRQAGLRFSNDTICKAVALRRAKGEVPHDS